MPISQQPYISNLFAFVRRVECLFSKAALALLFIVLCIPQAQAGQLSVAIVLSESKGAYQELGIELKNSLPSEYSVQVVGMESVIPVADIYVAAGMKAAESLDNRNQPILNVLVPHAGFEKLQRSPSATYSTIFMDQPAQRQLALINAALPNATSIGVLYDSSSVELDALRKQSKVMMFDLNQHKVDQQHPLAGALIDLLQVSDVLLVLPESNIYRADTIRNILLETYRAKVPMVGLSASYVRAGALCAIYSTPKQIAYQAAEAIESFANTGRLPAPQHTKEFEISVNNQVARSLGIPIKDAVQLRVEVRRRQ